MKIKFVMSCCVLMMALPLNAFALQENNISFQRLETKDQRRKQSSPVLVGGQWALSFGGGNQPFIDIGDQSCDGEISNAQIVVNQRVSRPIENVVGGEVFASAALAGTSKIITPIGVGAFAPNHCVSIGAKGSCSYEDQQNNGSAFSEVDAIGIVDACYATSRGNAAAPSNLNQYATMDIFLHILATGDCEFLQNQNFLNDRPLDFCGFIVDEDFSQRVLVGDTHLRTFHAGNGVLMTTGWLAASTEKSFDNYCVDISITQGCAVNHFWTARQRVRIDSNNENEVDVQMCTELAMSCRERFLAGGGTSNYRWTTISSAFFFARDYCLNESVLFDQDGNPVDASGDPVSFDEDGNPVDVDGDPIIGADGTPIGPNGGGGSDGSLFCNPIKVLINNTLGEEEATLTESSPGVTLGIAGLNEIPVAAFRDLETVMVQVAPGPVFRCNLIINDAATGQPVASFDPSDAAYDAATGMAVFDLSSEGPFAPGMYDVRVGTLYRAEVYVPIPGDVNLDGTVDTADRQIVLDNLSNGGVWTTGDVNNDGVVDELDLEIVDGQLPLLGDINGDGVVSFGDIGPLFDIIFGAPTQVEADINGDGAVNFGDIGPLFDLLFPQ